MPCKFIDNAVICSSKAKCRSCGAPIKWVKTDSGKNIPLNDEVVTILPEAGGNVVIVTLEGKVVRGKLAMAGTPGTVQGYISHFATCPQADKWRRGQG